MKQFENGQKVLARTEEGFAFEEYTYIGTIPDFNQRPHAVRNDNHGLRAVSDDNIKPVPVKKEGWVNVYEHKASRGVQVGQLVIYDTEAKAKQMAGSLSAKMYGTVKIEWFE